MEIPSVRFLSDLPFFKVPKQVPRRRPLAKLQQHIKTLAQAVSIAFLNHEKSPRYWWYWIILHVLKTSTCCNWGSFKNCSRTTSRSNIRAQHQVSSGIATSCEGCRFGPSRDMHATQASGSESGLGWRELFYARMGTLCYQTTTLCYIFSTILQIQFSLHDHLDIQAKLLWKSLDSPPDTESFAGADGCGLLPFLFINVLFNQL